jgi:hypothetical protein
MHTLSKRFLRNAPRHLVEKEMAIILLDDDHFYLFGIALFVTFGFDGPSVTFISK